MFFPPEFNQADALEASGFVLQAYQQNQAFRNGQSWSLEADNYECIEVIKSTPAGMFSGEEPFGFIAQNYSNRKLFVVFRGTESLEDWLSDLTLSQTDHPWGLVEKGFFNLYEQCSEMLKQIARNAFASEFIVTGHSLGAALAVLAAADFLAADFAQPISLYSFAGPRVGDLQFAGKFNHAIDGRAWRIINSEDLVPTLPMPTTVLSTNGALPRTAPTLLLHTLKKLSYTHIGEAVTFTATRGTVTDNHSMNLYNATLLARIGDAAIR